MTLDPDTNAKLGFPYVCVPWASYDVILRLYPKSLSLSTVLGICTFNKHPWMAPKLDVGQDTAREMP